MSLIAKFALVALIALLFCDWLADGAAAAEILR